MKKPIVAACLLIAFQGIAQKTLSPDYAYKTSAPYRVFDAKEKYYLTRGTEAIAVKFDAEDINIQKFDTEQPAFIKEQQYEDFFPKHYQIENVMDFDGKYYVFYSSWDGDNEKEQLFAQEIDFGKGEFTGKSRLLFQVDGKVTGSTGIENVMAGNATETGWFGFGGFGVQDKFQILQSQDRKHLLVQYRKKPKVKSDTKSFDVIGLYSYNSSLEKLSNFEMEMPYTERRMNNLDFQLDNQGNLYMLVKVFHDDSNADKKKRKDTEANYHVELFIVKNGTDKIQISKFENRDKFINKLWLFDTDKDYLVCAGFYSNGKGDFDDCDGIMGFKVKPDGKLYDEFYHEIPLEVLNQYESKKTQKKNEKKERKDDNAQFSDLVLKDIRFNEDGSLVLVGEQYFVIVHTTYSMNGGGSTYYTYHFCDMLVSKINPDGTLGWMKKISKNQMGTKGRGGMGYKYFNANDSHYFVFLDNVKNIDLPLDKEPKRHSDGQGGYLTAVKIADADGALRKGSILNARDVDDFGIYQFSTNRVFQTSQDSFMLEAYKKKKEDIMIKVTLK